MSLTEQSPDLLATEHPPEQDSNGFILVEQPTYPQLPSYDIGIERVKTRLMPNLVSPHGTFWRREVHLSDGEHHTEIVAVANNPTSEIPVVAKPAWWVSLKGYNIEAAEALMAEGIHSFLIGNAANKATALSHGAYAVHLSLDFDDGFGYMIDTKQILVKGDSNGAMQGTGILGYAPQFGRKVVDAFLVDPCIVHTLGPQDIKKLALHPTYVPKEIYSGIRQFLRFAKDPQTRVMDYVNVVEPTPEYLIGNIALSRALFSGEFGTILRHLPDEQKLHYLLFEHSIPNQKQDVIRILGEEKVKKNLDVTYEIWPGTHLSIINPRTIKAIHDYIVNSLLNR